MALITAVLMVALATMLAVDVGFRGFLDQRRAARCSRSTRAYEIALGAEAWAADFLKKDLQDSQTDHLGEVWARPLPPLPIEGGTVEGRLEDLQGRFNLNNLVHTDGTTNQEAVKQFERILAMLEIEPAWAVAIADWIDQDTQPGFPDGAEDTVYTGLDPPHLAANMPITRVSELLVLPQFGAERFRKLKPFVTALPVGTPVNVCTASGIVLDSFSEDSREFSLNPDDLANRRGTAASRRSKTCAARSAMRPTPRSRTRSRNRATTSAPPCGSLLAPPSSPCTVCSLAAAPGRCALPCAVSAATNPSRSDV